MSRGFFIFFLKLDKGRQFSFNNSINAFEDYCLKNNSNFSLVKIEF